MLITLLPFTKTAVHHMCVVLSCETLVCYAIIWLCVSNLVVIAVVCMNYHSFDRLFACVLPEVIKQNKCIVAVNVVDSTIITELY